MSFSLYVHVPYCLSKCPYCDFNAYAPKTRPEARYVDALCEEFTHAVRSADWRGEPLKTIYFGGGTPSLFQPASLARFLDRVFAECERAAVADVSLEADPASLTPTRLRGYRDVGIDRLSLGVQSFEPALLDRLGRLHDRDTALRAIRDARAAGFSDLNVDLIFSVPGQTLDMLDRDLERLFACGPEHIALYGLTYEENTPFFAMRAQGRLRPVDEETEAAMYARVLETCAAHGYEHYEISNFAQPGRASRHNLRYWRGGSYLGVGAGAHSFLPGKHGSDSPKPDSPETDARSGRWGRRWSNVRSPRAYMDAALGQGSAVESVEELTEEQACGEFVFLNLRQSAGVPLGAFAARFGRPFFARFPHATQLVTDGVLECAADRVTLSRRGLFVADSVFATFF